MNPDPASAPWRGLARLKLFLALSRTPHGLLDMATPVLTAILWQGGLPPWPVMLLGLGAAFGGYTAVYAINDLVDYRTDRAKIQHSDPARQTGYLDAALVRHPLARGLLGLPEAIAWTLCWTLFSFVCAWLLNPICALILVTGCLLEAVYCLLLRVSRLRALISGTVKTLGGLAAVFAVDHSPEPHMLLLLFLWLFCWEIGGQNVPADWHDLEEDAALGAKTIPVHYGPKGASRIALTTLIVSIAVGSIFLALAPLAPIRLLLLSSLIAGYFLLLLPAWRLLQSRRRREASVLFNRASYYPLSLLAIVLLNLLVRG